MKRTITFFAALLLAQPAAPHAADALRIMPNIVFIHTDPIRSP